MICKRVIYSGQVQGVGFRYTAHRLASGLAVAGYVQNLPDGTVELVAEGGEVQVDDLLSRVAQQMKGYILNADVSVEPLHNFPGFRIRH